MTLICDKVDKEVAPLYEIKPYNILCDPSLRLKGMETVLHIARFEKMKLFLINVLIENKNFF